MTRRTRRTPVALDAGDIRELREEEIALILRGADDLIMCGGRTLLAKILKGSREKKILDLGLHQSPAFGAFERLTIKDILARIDWLILNGYLAIEYDGRLPLLVFTSRGWTIERQTYTRELHARIDEQIAAGGNPPDLSWLNDRNREVVMALLDRIEASGNPDYIPALRIWSGNTYKKIRQRIERVLHQLSA